MQAVQSMILFAIILSQLSYNAVQKRPKTAQKPHEKVPGSFSGHQKSQQESGSWALHLRPNCAGSAVCTLRTLKSKVRLNQRQRIANAHIAAPAVPISCVTIRDEEARCSILSFSNESADSSFEQSLAELSASFSSLNATQNDALIELERLNRVLISLELPILRQWNFDKRKMHIVKKSLTTSIAAITTRFQHVSSTFGIEFEMPSMPCADCQDLLLSMKKRYPEIKQKDLIYLMLTCSPKSLSICKLQEAVGCSIHEARLAMELRRGDDHNAFVLPLWKSTGHPLNMESKQKIVQFYLDDLQTRPSPNARDARYGTHPLTGLRELHAKRLIPVNSSEFYRLFCEKYPEIKIHYSKFVKLRPAWCKWPGRFGHHNTCTCMAHENFRSKLQALQYNGRLTEFIHRYMCNEPGRDCYFGLCQMCPRVDEINELPTGSDTVTFELWKQQNKRMTYVTVTQSTDDLIQELQEEFITFTTHHYTTKQQGNFIESLSGSCLEEKALIIKVDFAENYAFNAQNSPTAFHWNNDQATIHPFCVSFPLNDKLEKINFVVVSNTLEHSALSFHLFRSKVIKELEKETWFSFITKVYYISDGAGSQYKNRFNFCTLFDHEHDFGLPAEWVFTATAHGKSECDATSGAVKSSAHRAAWAGTTILSAAQLYDYFQRSMTTPQRRFIFADKEELEVVRVEKRDQFESAETVRGTRRFHSVQVIQTGLRFRVLSADLEFVDVKIGKHSKKTNNTSNTYAAGTYVVVKSSESGGVVGRVMAWEPDGTAIVSLMKASGKKNSLTWPLHEQLLSASPHQFLMKLNDPIAAGRSARYFKLLESDFKNYLDFKP